MVWEAKAAPFWMERGGKVVGPYRLMAARDVLDPGRAKYFLSGAVGVPTRVTLHVGLSRWPVERCLEDEKTELGLSHFECRKYPAVLRHLLVTQISHLFLARQASRLRGEKRRGAGHGLPGPHCCRGPAGGLAPGRHARPAATDRPGRGEDPPDAGAECRGAKESHEGPPPSVARVGHPRRTPDLLPSAVTTVAL